MDNPYAWFPFFQASHFHFSYFLEAGQAHTDVCSTFSVRLALPLKSMPSSHLSSWVLSAPPLSKITTNKLMGIETRGILNLLKLWASICNLKHFGEFVCFINKNKNQFSGAVFQIL